MSSKIIDQNRVCLSAVISGIRALKDSTLSIQFHTQEMPGEVSGKLFSLMNKYIGVVITTEDIQNEDLAISELQIKEHLEVNKMPESNDGKKSPSMRLRDILFIKWQKLEIEEDFESYYQKRINQYIENERNIINDL